MRLPIDTSGMTFMCAAPARPVTDFDTGQHKADVNGELLFNVQVVALDDDGAQIISVKVPGDPKLGQGAMLRFEGLGGDAVVDERPVRGGVPGEPRPLGGCGRWFGLAATDGQGRVVVGVERGSGEAWSCLPVR